MNGGKIVLIWKKKSIIIIIIIIIIIDVILEARIFPQLVKMRCY
jgi:hypothetical protein